MDRSLDDAISDRQRNNSRVQQRGSRQNNYPRDGVRKSQRDEPRSLDRDWVHDRYDDDTEHRRPSRYSENERSRRDHRDAASDVYIPRLKGAIRDLIESSPSSTGTKVRVTNLHYDLTEEDLTELFERIGPTLSCRLEFDRQDRSRGVANVTYADARDARQAVREFDGANANGQPIYLKLSTDAPAARPARNPFDYAEAPTRSLIDRIEPPAGGPRRSNHRRSSRSASPDDRYSRSHRAAPEHVDRYVPGGSRDSARRGPRENNGGGRRPGQRRDQSGARGAGGRDDGGGRPMVQGRPRKTAQELDAEMEDYWGSAATGGAEGSNGAATTTTTATAAADEDVDMIV